MANIINVCASISGTKLQSGEKLSFNFLTGKKTSANEYKNAPNLIDGEKSYGIGGGVYQVSTTLLMVATNAGLEITEYHNHSEGVAYYVWIQDGRCYAKIVQSN